MVEDKIRIELFIDTTWVKGYCFGTGRKRADVIAAVRGALEKECEDITECRYRVIYSQKGWTSNDHWAVRVVHPGLEAPLGCAVRRMGQVCKAVMRKALMDMTRKDAEEGK